MKKKGLWITLGAVAAVVIIFVILSFTLFALKSVKVDFRSSTLNLTGQEEKIIESGKFSYGGSVLFMGKKGAIKKLERENPYLKVVNIETVFPSSYVIHATERLEVYAVETESGVIITDEEFKVLRREDGEYSPAMDKPILFKNLTIENIDAQPGEFLRVTNAIDMYSAFIECNRAIHEQKALLQSIEVGTLYDENIHAEQASLKINLYDGQTYLIKNASVGLKYKIDKMLSVYSNIFSELVGKPIDKTDPESAVWTKEIIQKSVIEISNSYLTDDKGNFQYYFKVIPPQNSSNI